MDEAQAKRVLTKIIQRRTTLKFEAHLAKIFGLPTVRGYLCKVANGKTIPQKKMEDLSKSYIYENLESLVQVILSSKKPLQTGKILSVSVVDSDDYGDESKINKSDSVNAGYLLQMSGFEFVSVYDNDRKMPVKVWKAKCGTENIGYKERAKIAKDQVQSEIEKAKRHVNTYWAPFLNRDTPFLNSLV